MIWAMTNTFRSRLLEFYEKNEAKIDILFFVGGFVFDVVTLSEIDDPWALAQQFVYLLVIGCILLGDLVLESRPYEFPNWFQRMWQYRGIATHFFLGSLFSVYSLFFLKSSSIFSSFVFVFLLMAVMIGNELKTVRDRGLDVKMALYLICLFCFFSIVFPVVLGQVGWLPFFLSLITITALLFGAKKLLTGRVPAQWIQRRVLVPGAAVVVAVFLLYQVSWIPPVPLALIRSGVYHGVEKVNGEYRLAHERSWWKVWHTGDQDFLAAPGDKIYFFASVYSPARFADSVILHFWQKNARGTWESTDRIPMNITGGRQGGFRGTAVKQNYSPGEWCVTVESNDGREIGRRYFSVEAVPAPAEARVWQTDVF